MSVLTGTFSIPMAAFVRPCAQIAPEMFTADGFIATIADRYSVMTTDLPLVGGAGMHPVADDSMALINGLRMRQACAVAADCADASRQPIYFWNPKSSAQVMTIE